MELVIDEDAPSHAPPSDHARAAALHLTESMRHVLRCMLGACACRKRQQQHFVRMQSISPRSGTLKIVEAPWPDGIFDPTSAIKSRWDVSVMVLIMYSAATVPFRFAFDAEAAGTWWNFEACMSIVFVMDLIFSFHTAYLDMGGTPRVCKPPCDTHVPTVIAARCHTEQSGSRRVRPSRAATAAAGFGSTRHRRSPWS